MSAIIFLFQDVDKKKTSLHYALQSEHIPLLIGSFKTNRKAYLFRQFPSGVYKNLLCILNCSKPDLISVEHCTIGKSNLFYLFSIVQTDCFEMRCHSRAKSKQVRWEKLQGSQRMWCIVKFKLSLHSYANKSIDWCSDRLEQQGHHVLVKQTPSMTLCASLFARHTSLAELWIERLERPGL